MLKQENEDVTYEELMLQSNDPKVIVRAIKTRIKILKNCEGKIQCAESRIGELDMLLEVLTPQCCSCHCIDVSKLQWMKDVVGGDDWALWCRDCLQKHGVSC